jgi:hypothetical protein
MVSPVGASFAVDGHLTKMRLRMGPFVSFRIGEVGIILIIRVDRRFVLYQYRRGTSRVLRDRPSSGG